MEKDDPPKPVLSLLFWAALMFALACIVGGAAIGFYGSKLFPAPAASPHALGKSAPPR